MKKSPALLLALVLCLSLTACVALPVVPISSTDQSPARTEAPTTAAPATEAPTEAPTTAAPVTEAPTEAPATRVPTTEAPPETTEAPADLGVRGVLEDNVYVNEYLNLRVALPEDWIFFTEEQIAMVYQMTAEMWDGTDVEELIATYGQFMDMLAQSLDGSSVNLIIQPNSALLDAYSDLMIFQLSEETITAQMKAGGMDVVYYDPMTAQISGEDHAVLHMVVQKDGSEFEEFQLWFRVGKEYMGILTFTLMGERDLQDVLSCVTTLN